MKDTINNLSANTIESNLKSSLQEYESNERIEGLDITRKEEFKGRISYLKREYTHSNPLFIQPGVHIGKNTKPQHITKKKPLLIGRQNWREYPNNEPSGHPPFYDTTVDLSNHQLVEVNMNHDPLSPQIFWLEIQNTAFYTDIQNSSNKSTEEQTRTFNVRLHGQHTQSTIPLETVVKAIATNQIILYPQTPTEIANDRATLPDTITNTLTETKSDDRALEYLGASQQKYANKLSDESKSRVGQTSTQFVEQMAISSSGNTVQLLEATSQFGTIPLTEFDGVTEHTFRDDTLRTLQFRQATTPDGKARPIIITIPVNKAGDELKQRSKTPTEEIAEDQKHHAHVYTVPTFITLLENMQITLCNHNNDPTEENTTKYTLIEAAQINP